MGKFDVNGFIRECYLSSEPSVDLCEVTETVNCWEHKLAVTEYDRICREFGVTGDLETACNMWMLREGPQLVDA